VVWDRNENLVMTSGLAKTAFTLLLASTFALSAAQAQLAQQGPKLVGSAATLSARQGDSVALSADGNTAIVGGDLDSSEQGAAWVWTRTAGIWTQQGTKLVGTGAVGNARQGHSVAISADGNTVIVGGYFDNSLQGAAWVWMRSGGTWTQQGAKLVGASASGNAGQGVSVALSADGNTAIVGGYLDNSNQGAAWVWTRSGGVWTQQGPKLVGTGAVGAATEGASVALSADGNTAIVGGPGDDGVGAVWTWTRSGGTWTQQGPKLVGTGAVGTALEGSSVALSADSNTAIIGGYFDNSFLGAAWVWTRSGGVWTQQGPKLVGSGAVGGSSQGYSVALSADGNTALVGGPFDDFNLGAVWLWMRTGGVWTQQGPKLRARDSLGNPDQGTSIALSADGSTAVIGGPLDAFSGAAFVFATPADLRIAKAVDRSIQTVFGQVSYTITVTNGGPAAATFVVVTDTIPAGSTLVSASPSQGTCSGSPTVTCSVGNLANGATMTIALTVQAPSTPTTMTNTASVNAAEPDPTPADNTSSASIPIVAIPMLAPKFVALAAFLLAVVGATVMKPNS
jgi:uncharacterized repeat protein (TIGR01451 family)